MNRQLIATIYKELRQRRWAILAYCVIALAFIWMYLSIFPSFQKESAKFNELLEAYPKALLEAFNIKDLQISTVEGYIAAEHFSFVWPIMVILLMLSTAGQAIAGEIERGTMSIMLSLPVSRLKIFLSKYLAGILMLVIFCTVSIVSIFPLASVMDLKIQTDHIWMVTLISFLFGWVILSAGMMVSSFASERSKVYFTIGGTLLVMYVFNIVSGLIESAEKLQYGSLFYYYAPSDALVKGEIDSLAVIVMAGTAIVCTIIGAIAFTRRDISV